MKFLGPPVDDCTWTGWIDNDNPLRHCDCESPPDGCMVQDYEIKDISTGTVYTLDVLCLQQIKLFQVVSTSEFHEY